jgi:hypothetical protein
MCTVVMDDKASRIKQGLPVLLPVLLVVSLTASFRIVNSTSVGQLVPSGMSNNNAEKYNSTEDTLLQYEATKRLLELEKDKEALAQLQSLQHKPVRISEGKCRDPKLENIHPKSVILSVAIQMMHRVKNLEQEGDIETARKYVRTMHNLSNCLLENNAPTTEEQELAQHIQKLATKSETKLHVLHGDALSGSYQW